MNVEIRFFSDFTLVTEDYEFVYLVLAVPLLIPTDYAKF